MPTIAQERVHDLLHQMPTEGLKSAKRLFWTELNYDRANTALSQREWPERAKGALAEAPTILAQHKSEFGSFDVIYSKLAKDQRGRGFALSLTAERLVIKQLLKNHPYALFLFSDADEQHWHLVNVRYDKESVRRRVFRRISIGPYERLRTAAERVAMLDLASLSPDLFGLSPIAIQQRHDDAFDVEAVTREFFKEYQLVFRNLQADLNRQTKDTQWAHDYALQFLNRVMFMYFIQRKRWLGDNPDFLANFWGAYSKGSFLSDTFVSGWLEVLFFEAFNNGFQAGRADREYLPDGIRKALAMAPYLNGGLFEPNELDRKHQFAISDARFQEVFKFLEGYNFTISEDTPLDQEVAVDPEMIGKVYESLVNVSEEADEQGEAGIFYTPRVEIDLMCRLALVDWLTNWLGREMKSDLYELVFAFDPEDKERADAKLAQSNLWHQLNDLLRKVTVVDPACGSGSFLVGMLYVLDDLLARADKQLGQEEDSYQRRKRIIGTSLYGVDVMDWAVHVAELRLWLQLVIETELAPEKLQFRPLLPNLSFRVRPGDSLVQEVGGINLARRKGSRLIPAPLKRRITRLKNEKLKFYDSGRERKHLNEKQLNQAEIRLFRDILETRAKTIDERIKEIDQALRPHVNLFGDVQDPQLKLSRISLQQEHGRLEIEREQIRRGRETLQTANDVPFVWDIAFVEVLESDKGGFDIVVGNPPYVRQESIHDPHQSHDQVTVAKKKAYKAKLARSVYAAWPLSFAYKLAKDKAQWKLSGKSDLYIYFYLHGLSLLNDKGSFCFITSNSWLDVGYGKDLQKFLLTRGQVKLVLDNQVRRSFARADVNTVIVLLGSPQDTRRPIASSLEHVARFVMLTVPFEQVLSPVIWEEVDEATSRRTTPEYRVFPLTQAKLLENGMDPRKKRYAGDKWGGKYLRAPDIYWVIMEKAKDKLVRLGDIADVRFGIKTGANEFFYLDDEKIARWGIEEEFLLPVIKSPRECRRILIDSNDLKYKIFMCHRDKKELKGTAALQYIKWGESQGFHKRPSCRGRARWWKAKSETGNAVFVKEANDTSAVFYNPALQPVDCRLYCADLTSSTLVYLNSSLAALMFEIYNRAALGEGARSLMVDDYVRVPCLDPTLLNNECAAEMLHTILPEKPHKFHNRDTEPWRTMDLAICHALGLSVNEVDAVYGAVVRLVEARLRKAESLGT